MSEKDKFTRKDFDIPLNVQIIELIKSKPELMIEVYKSKGYKFFDKGLFNVNNFGIRVSADGRNFDDIIGSVFAREKNGQFETIALEGTTDPGSYYLKNPINVLGTAILAPGQYHGYRMDKHRGQYDALCQRKGRVKVYRDNDKDETIEINLSELKEGMFGINIHKTSHVEQVQDKNMFSAGCQEIMNSAEYEIDWMPVQFEAIKTWGEKGCDTYTLFTLEDCAVILKHLDKGVEIKTDSSEEE